MTFVIYDGQSTFVEDRLIIDNFMVAFEAFVSMYTGKINNTNHLGSNLILIKLFTRLSGIT